jgi:hypothetical protein
VTRTLFLHIGAMKSATSFLQSLCTDNREPLLEQGLLWPETPRYEAAGQYLAAAESGPRPDHVAAWDRLCAELDAHAGNAFWSNELLAVATVAQARRLVEDLPVDEVEVIVTARDLGRVVPSQWNTAVKNGTTLTWPEFAGAVCADVPVLPPRVEVSDSEESRERQAAVHARRFWRRQDLPGIIDRWARVVAPARIHLVPIDLAGDWMVRLGAVLGASLTHLPAVRERVNESLGAHSLELVRRMYLDGSMDDLDRHLGVRQLVCTQILALRADTEPRIGLTQPQQDWIRQRAGRLVEAVRGSGVHVHGDLEVLLPAAQVPDDVVDPTSTSEPVLRRLAQELAAELARLAVGGYLQQVDPVQAALGTSTLQMWVEDLRRQ